MAKKRVLFAEKKAEGATAKGTPVSVLFRAFKAKDGYIAVNVAWEVGDLKHASERMFGPMGGDKDVYGEIDEWAGKIAKQAGAREATKWRKAGE
jgi:hypothetical protein